MSLMDFAREGDTVMICKHLFEHARRGDPIPLSDLPREGRHDPPKRFTREDGSDGAAHFFIYCRACWRGNHKRVDFVEELVCHGKLHVADFMRRGGCGARS